VTKFIFVTKIHFCCSVSRFQNKLDLFWCKKKDKMTHIDPMDQFDTHIRFRNPIG